MENFLQDLRYAARILLKRPGFTAVAVLTLALGIGANTTIFSVINAVLLRPLPYPDAERLIAVLEQHASQPQRSVSPPNYFDWRDHNQVFEAVAATRGWSVTLTGEGEPRRLNGAAVSGDFFTVLGVNPMLGQGIMPQDDRPGAERVVILSHDLWQTYFGADPKVIGSKIMLDDVGHRVAGVMPEGFDFPDGARLWRPLADSFAGVQRDTHFLRVYARLKAGLSIADARSDLERITSWISETDPGSETSFGAVPVSLRELLVGDTRPALLILLGAVGLVLGIACANVANLLLAKAADREREIAIRLAVGAGRARIIRQLLTESLLLCLIGGAAGLLLAAWGIDLLLTLKPADIPRLKEVFLDGKVFAFTAVTALVTALSCGLMPALQASKLNFNRSLKEGGRGGSAGRQRNRIQSLLVISEVALALMLLIGAGLLVKSFIQLQAIDPGFDSDRIITVRLSLPRARYAGPQEVGPFYSRLIERMNGLPGAGSVGATSRLPLQPEGDFIWQFRKAEDRQGVDGGPVQSSIRIITPGYFEAMGIHSRKGRRFTESDRSESPNVVIISQSIARLLWPDEDPLGKRIYFSQGTVLPHEEAWEIVGVVDSVRDERLDIADRHEIYIPHAQLPARSMMLAVRTAADPSALAGPIREAIWSFDRSLPLERLETMEGIVSRSLAQPRFYALLLMIFAGVALTMSIAGIYGVMAYSVAQRTGEFGIRIALGARPRDILKLVLRRSMALAFAGIALGLSASFALTRFLSSLLYATTPVDTVTFATVSVLLIACSLAACYIPARRATKVDPMIALRYE
ncbi:MAG: ABC transporter permease [Blastocatellia bacterium]|nr:ABC transporter permease [Blastocatellia bacterium]